MGELHYYNKRGNKWFMNPVIWLFSIILFCFVTILNFGLMLQGYTITLTYRFGSFCHVDPAVRSSPLVCWSGKVNIHSYIAHPVPATLTSSPKVPTFSHPPSPPASVTQRQGTGNSIHFFKSCLLEIPSKNKILYICLWQNFGQFLMLLN